jgi:hypothetical protein
MENKKGQSLIDIIFSLTVLILVLTGVIALVIGTTKAKTLVSERKKAIEFSQKKIEDEIQNIKENPLVFWSGSTAPVSSTDSSFPGYKSVMTYDSSNCQINGDSNDHCNLIFTISWGNNQTLSVARFFTRQGI